MLSGYRPRYVHLRHTYPLIRYTNVSGRWRGNEPQSDALLIGRMETDASRRSQNFPSSPPSMMIWCLYRAVYPEANLSLEKSRYEKEMPCRAERATARVLAQAHPFWHRPGAQVEPSPHLAQSRRHRQTRRATGAQRPTDRPDAGDLHSPQSKGRANASTREDCKRRLNALNPIGSTSVLFGGACRSAPDRPGACSEPPRVHNRWSLKLLADKAVELGIVEKVSHETVRKTLKKTNSSITFSSSG